MKRYSPLPSLLPLLLSLLAVSPSLLQESSAQVEGVMVGFAPWALFPVDRGIPIFLRGEEIWVMGPEVGRVTLIDPEGRVRASKALLGGPLLLHRFSDEDPIGHWALAVKIKGARISMPLLLESSELKVRGILSSVELDLGGRIILKGRLEVDPMEAQGKTVLVLTKVITEESPIDRILNFTINGKIVGLKVLEREGIVLFTPYIVEEELAEGEPGLLDEEEEIAFKEEAEVELIAWAEALQEVPFLRLVDGSEVVTLVKEPVARFGPRRIFIGVGSNETLELRLPQLHTLGEDGKAPLRWGPLTLTLFLQDGERIHLFTLETFYLPQGGGLRKLGVQEVSPLVKEVRFSFTEQLSDLAPYSIAVLSSRRGINRVWSQVIDPLLAKVKVVSSGSGETIMDYELHLTGVEVSKGPFGDSFALLPHERMISTYTISISGIQLEPYQVKPPLLELKAGELSLIFADASRVSFQILDNQRRPIQEGRIRLERMSPQEPRPSSQLSWSLGNMPSLFLPRGLYRALVEAEGSKEELIFEVGTTNLDVVVVMEEVGPRLDPFWVGLGLLILGIEAVLATLVWRKALRLRLKLSGPLGPSS